jgi:predicted histidine transporter YuiF (NhaC family)
VIVHSLHNKRATSASTNSYDMMMIKSFAVFATLLIAVLAQQQPQQQQQHVQQNQPQHSQVSNTA